MIFLKTHKLVFGMCFNLMSTKRLKSLTIASIIAIYILRKVMVINSFLILI